MDMKKKEKILIVDDSEMNRALLSGILEEDYDLIEAENGIKAIEILRREPEIELMLLDINMPEMDGFGVGATYAKSDRTNNQVRAGEVANTMNAGGDNAEVWAAGLKYDANNIYLATMYSETRNMTPYGDSGVANKTQNFEVTAQYQFDFGLRPAVSFLMSKGKDLNATDGLVKYVEGGMTYYFNKNMSTYVDYKINLLDEDDSFYTRNNISTDDVVALGLVYQF